MKLLSDWGPTHIFVVSIQNYLPWRSDAWDLCTPASECNLLLTSSWHEFITGLNYTSKLYMNFSTVENNLVTLWICYKLIDWRDIDTCLVLSTLSFRLVYNRQREICVFIFTMLMSPEKKNDKQHWRSSESDSASLLPPFRNVLWRS